MQSYSNRNKKKLTVLHLHSASAKTFTVLQMNLKNTKGRFWVTHPPIVSSSQSSELWTGLLITCYALRTSCEGERRVWVDDSVAKRKGEAEESGE